MATGNPGKRGTAVKMAIMVDIPDEVMSRVQMVSKHYGLPVDPLAQKFLIDCFNDVYANSVVVVAKAMREAGDEL